MSHSWEDICDSQEFVHTQRFVEVEDYRTLEAQFQEQKKLVERLRKGLEFYADKENWTSNDIHSWNSYGSTIKGMDDECFANRGEDGSDWRSGKLARQVLKELK